MSPLSLGLFEEAAALVTGAAGAAFAARLAPVGAGAAPVGAKVAECLSNRPQR